jgi:hypothetical protein
MLFQDYLKGTSGRAAEKKKKKCNTAEKYAIINPT